MDGVHDLGGVEGFGAVVVEADEPVFHHEWERRVFGCNFAAIPGGVDPFRHAIERMGARAYLSTSYYEHWLVAIETRAVESGVVPAAALEAARVAVTTGASVPRRDDPARAAATVAAVRTPSRPGAVAPGRFGIGDLVRVSRRSPPGHTRCPRYVRGAVGVVDAHHGTVRLPDASAAGRDEAAPLYGVRFDARDLWGAGAHQVHLDLWEPYLEPEPTGEPELVTTSMVSPSMGEHEHG